jgi:hypothetical protein
MLWQFVYLMIIAGCVWLLDRYIDPYPPRLPHSTSSKWEIGIVCIFWAMALVINTIWQVVIDPSLLTLNYQPYLRELIYLPYITLLFLILPLYLSLRVNHYPISELGLTIKNRSPGVAVFALLFGTISGGVAFLTGKTVVGVTSLSAGALLLLIYNNAFIEEFFYRGIIQNRLERVVSQRWAVVAGGVLFASSHVLLDYLALANQGGLASVLYALIMQFLAGCLLGLIFMKTRTLWPGVICHYLVNWLPSILSLLLD